MGTERFRASVPMTEPWPVEDVLCSGLGAIEDLECCARFVLYRSTTLYPSNEIFPAVCAKIILPYSAIMPGLNLTGQFAATKALAPARNIIRLIHR